MTLSHNKVTLSYHTNPDNIAPYGINGALRQHSPAAELRTQFGEGRVRPVGAAVVKDREGLSTHHLQPREGLRGAEQCMDTVDFRAINLNAARDWRISRNFSQLGDGAGGG